MWLFWETVSGVDYVDDDFLRLSGLRVDDHLRDVLVFVWCAAVGAQDSTEEKTGTCDGDSGWSSTRPRFSKMFSLSLA